ncbi:MAG: ABC transporter ATP-binding protein [Victivallaceae bacterium]|jgi:oligopeptide/dipeptide ABC transporter ATP-binding protein|nr:ABC transporter ATP-binding protein [Victivallaceae bacterium]MDD3116767.1 ABC transporter ATP-binding protein [Victivallaceae bacterium]MDD3702725.1 ABC transporter ATP-binding protein [Victivallaceae bacterium]MDD4317833.1 ABC transporter ATP-binding protein [Victivallaceae bacterium]MDD5662753.1 ABC transporter ATP-binding protein [Victivallaceae bacterium]
MPLLKVRNLSIEFNNGGRFLPVVSEVSFDVGAGEILALVGESGCGKSVSCMALAGLLPRGIARVSGEIEFTHREAVSYPLQMSGRDLRKIRGGGIAYIFQEPSSSLNPVFRIGDQIIEALELHRPEISDYQKEAVKLLKQVGIPAPETRLRSFPHEMSGGMQQRVMIAMALAGKPSLLVADEPTTALDVTIQSQILELLQQLRVEHQMGIILVTHNLGIVAEMADRVAVMYAGNIVETGSATAIIENPQHPYTKALLAAVPKLHHSQERLFTIPGMVPQPADFPPGCRFSGRCSEAAAQNEEFQSRCRNEKPHAIEFESGHFSNCFLNPGSNEQ